jgi:DNA-binding transcriptional regulator YhcF (GntR family)
MKDIKVALCFLDEEGNAIIKKPLGADWNVKQFNEFHNLLIEDQVAEIIVEAIKMGVTSEVIKEMLKELKKEET